MIWQELQATIMTILLAVITAAVPTLTVMAVRYIGQKVKEVRLSLTPEQNALIDEAIQLGIHAAQQNGLSKKIEDTARAKLDNAIATAQAYLNVRGLSKISVAEIEARIEQGIFLGWKEAVPTT